MPIKRIPLASVPIAVPQVGLCETNWYDFFRESIQPQILADYANDAAAAAGGVPQFGLYRTGSTVKVRMT